MSKIIDENGLSRYSKDIKDWANGRFSMKIENPQLYIDVESGATVHATKGTSEFTAMSVDGVAIVNLDSFGSWHVYAAKVREFLTKPI